MADNSLGPGTPIGDPATYLDQVPTTDENGDPIPGALSFDPTLYAAAKKVSAGQPLTAGEIPKGFTYKDGRLIPQGMSNLKLLGIMAAFVGGSIIAGALAPGAAAAGGGSGAASAATGLAADGTIPATFQGATALAPALAGGGGALATGTAAAATATAPSIWDRIATGLTGASKAVGAATQATGQNRITAADQAAQANARIDQLKEQAQRDYETTLQGRAKTEADQRHTALQDVYRAGWYQNRTASPNNTRGLPPLSPEFMATLSDLEKQAMLRLHQGPQYGTDTMAPPTVFQPTPYTPSQPGATEKVGTWATPILGVAGSLLNGPSQPGQFSLADLQKLLGH